MIDTASFMLERGLQYNVFEVSGGAFGYLINRKLFNVRSDHPVGFIDHAGYLVQQNQRAGVVRGMAIVMNNGDVLTLVRVPF